MKRLNLDIDDLDIDLFRRYYRRIVYLEIMEPRFSSMRGAVIHFCLLDYGKMQEYEIRYEDSAEFYHGFVGMMDRYIFADIFRNYRFSTGDYSYRVLIHKGAILDANNDLGGFVFQNNKNSHLISPYEREVFERLRDDMSNGVDGVAQLVRVGRLLKNEKFCKIHDEFFGKIGKAALNDGTTIKQRYADSIANNNVITDANLFKEYLDSVNAIPMSEFTEQSVVTQLANGNFDTKQVLMENYSNFLFADEDEIELAAMILDLFLRRTGPLFSLYDWSHAIGYIRSLNGESFLRASESEVDLQRVLRLYRANYVIRNVQLPKLVHFIYDFFDFNNLSRNIGAFYPRLNELVGEDMREKYLHLETINVSLKSLQESRKPEEFFLEPKLVNFSTTADKEIQERIMSGNYSHVFAAYYFCNYILVADYKKYSDVLPAIVSVIKNLEIKDDDDFGLFWVAGDLLNEFWKLAPSEDGELRAEIEKLIYSLYWPLVGDVWPVVHRREASYNDELRAQAFIESLGWVMSVKGDQLYGRELRKYLGGKTDISNVNMPDPVDKKRQSLRHAKQKDRSFANYIKGREDEEEWWFAAVDCDDVSDGEIMAKLIDVDSSLLSESQKKVLERLLLKVRSQKDADELCAVLIGRFDEFYGFLARLAGGKNDVRKVSLNALMALCESVTGSAERDYAAQLSQKMIEKMAEKSFQDDAKRALEIADARIRLVKLQNKDVTAEFIKSLF